MKTVSANMTAHLALGHTTLNTCWKYVRPHDSSVLGFTDHDIAISYDGVAYTPLASGNPSQLSQSNRLNPDNLDSELPFASGAFTAAALRAGVWNNAQYWVFLINPNATADGIIKLTCGRLGEIQIADYLATIEHRSLTQQLSTPILRLITPECNASLADARCGIAEASIWHSGSVGVVTSNKIFTVSGAAATNATGDDYYNYGKIVWTAGNNSGLSMQVDDYTHSGNLITLIEAMPYTVTAGDTIKAYQGCDRRKTTCINTFSNVVNFRGFDLLPGLDRVVVIPNNRRWVTDS